MSMRTVKRKPIKQFRFILPYKRTEWGEALVTAASLKEAKDGVFSVMEEYDNKSEYEWDYSQLRVAKRSPRGCWE